MRLWRTIFGLCCCIGLVLASCVPATPVPTVTPVPISTDTPSPTFTITPSQTPTITPVVIDIKIRIPLEGEKVNAITTVEGTSQNVPEGSVIWVVVFLPVVQSYFPVNDPAVIQVNGEWISQAYIGQAGEIGLEADIYVVLANREAQDAFNAYLTEAINKNDFPGMKGLPQGAQVYDRVSVTRK